MRPTLSALFAALALVIGIAVFGTGVAAADTPALSGYDAVSFQSGEPGRPVPGTPEHSAVWDGREWHFASAANREAFLADPDRYAPQFDGHCAWAASQGYVAAGDPRHHRVVDGKLYLQFNARALSLWERDVAGNIAKGDANWPSIKPE